MVVLAKTAWSQTRKTAATMMSTTRMPTTRGCWMVSTWQKMLPGQALLETETETRG